MAVGPGAGQLCLAATLHPLDTLPTPMPLPSLAPPTQLAQSHGEPSSLLESRLEISAERVVMPLARPGEMGVAGCTEGEVMDPRYW